MTIKIKFRPSTIFGQEGAIYYQIIHNRIVRQYLTSYRIFSDEWDSERSLPVVKNTSPRNQLIRAMRDNIRWDIERFKRIFHKFEFDDSALSLDDIIEQFKSYISQYSLFNYLGGIILKLKENEKYRTAETYRACLNSFRKFRNGEDILLDCVNTTVIEAYEAWHTSQGNTRNTISFYMRILRAVYNRAVEDEIIENKFPFRRVYTGVDKTVKRALELSVLKKIKKLDLSLDASLDYARDLFLMSFYLRGMSFIDMAYLKKSDLKNGYLEYRRRKTGQRLTIAWNSEMQKIIDKYPLNPTPYLLPIIRSVGVNERYVYRYACYIVNHNLKKIALKIGLNTPLTMYVARHSWASAAKANGIPVSVISEGMGHDSESTTRIYLASLDTTVIDKANAKIIKSL